MMKRLSIFILVFMLVLSGCTTPADTINTPEPVAPDAESAVKAVIEAKVSSVKTGDKQALMALLDPEDKELQTEQANWLTDIIVNPVEDYNLELLELEKISDDIYKARLRQQYREGREEHKLDYFNKFKYIGNQIYDAGNYFEEIKQGNVIIKYTQENKELAESIIADINDLYDANIVRWGLTPDRPLVVKMFESIEELRQSIKFSMWQCAGWYEYGESVKMYITRALASKDRIERIVNHEMIHLFTVEKSGGNLAYWLSEGIASYYEASDGQKKPKTLLKDMDVRLLTIDEIEAIELEKLEDRKKISNYYNNAHLITAFMIERYGEEKLMEILSELGKLPSFSGTTSENDIHYRQYLSLVLPKVLGLDGYEQFKQVWKNEISRL